MKAFLLEFFDKVCIPMIAMFTAFAILFGLIYFTIYAISLPYN